MPIYNLAFLDALRSSSSYVHVWEMLSSEIAC